MKILASLLLALISASDGFRVNSASKDVAIPIEYCALVSAPEAYDGQRLKLHGVYEVAGTDVSTFSDSACQVEKTLWVEFSRDFQSCSDQKAVKSLSEMKRKSGARWARPHVTVVTGEFRSAEVQFVGTFSSNNSFKPIPTTSDTGPLGALLTNRQRADFVFVVRCIERLKVLPRKAKN
ncbi:MAG TPA: hypothetical protein VE980_08040 [Pyrinomonadaceae bacterium]|nr:hypothetical protein [Pyrinomonadaceae bacterium]